MRSTPATSGHALTCCSTCCAVSQSTSDINITDICPPCAKSGTIRLRLSRVSSKELGNDREMATTSQISTVEKGRAMSFRQLLLAATRCCARHAIAAFHFSAEARATVINPPLNPPDALNPTSGCGGACERSAVNHALRPTPSPPPD